MEDTKKPVNEQMTESDKFRMMSDFSKGLTLWGSNKVVKKWLRYRKALLEDIIYEIRKDVGQRKKLGKGDMLSFFINDIEKIIKNKHLYSETLYKCCNMGYTNTNMKKEVI